jgi:hypothetical protein
MRLLASDTSGDRSIAFSAVGKMLPIISDSVTILAIKSLKAVCVLCQILSLTEMVNDLTTECGGTGILDMSMVVV